MSFRRVAPVLAAVLALSHPRAAQAVTGAVNVANQVESARALGMGGVAAALGADASLAWQTPSALAQTPRPAVVLSGAQGLVDDALGQALLAWPLGAWTVGAGAAYYDAGELTLNRLDGTSSTVRAQQDWLGQAGAATSLFQGDAAAGASVKYLRSELFEKFSAAAWTADLGAQVRIMPGVKLGLALANVAGALGYTGAASPLPMALRGGAAAGGSFGEGMLAGALIGAGEWEYLAAEKLLLWKAGLEYQWQGKLSLRTGARSGAGGQPVRVAGGLGIRVGALRVDYALASAKGFDVLPQTLALTVEF